MKHPIYLIILVAFGVITTSCNRMEKEIFGQSAAQRTNQYMDSVSSILTSSENGWEMIVFPTPDMKGLNVLVKFDKEQLFTAAAKNELTTNNEYKEAGGSMWQMLSNQGPCLSFDTYNDVMHAFAEPTLSGYTKGVGMKGDFEYLVVSADPNELILKSKKRGTYNVMRRLDPSQEWKDYFTQIESQVGKTFNNHNILTAKVGDTEYSLYDGASGVFKAMPKGVIFTDSLSSKYPFAFTKNGICLMEGFPGYTDVRQLELRENFGYINGEVSISAGNVYRYIPNYCLSISYGWRALPKNMGPELKALVDAVSAQLKAIGGKSSDGVTALNIGYKESKVIDKHKVAINTYVMQVAYKLSGKQQEPMDFAIDLVVTDTDLAITYKAPVDDNAQKLLTACPQLEAVFAYFTGAHFAATTDNPLNPTYGINLTHKDKNETFSITNTDIK